LGKLNKNCEYENKYLYLQKIIIMRTANLKETKYLMSSPEMMKRLRSAENNMKAGKGIKINIKDL